MKFLTKQLDIDLDLHEIHCAVSSREKRALPLVFLNGSHEGVDESDIITVKTNFNISDKENEISFMILPATFTFFGNGYEYVTGKEIHSPENDFLSEYINRLRLISYLPEQILKMVTDKRLLAMGYAEQKVKKALIKYIKLKKAVALMVYQKSIKDSIKAAEGLTIEDQFGIQNYYFTIDEFFENAFIEAVSIKGNDLYFELSEERDFVLTDVEILEEEVKPDNTFIKFFELHKAEQGYELHFLLMTKDSNLVEYFHYVTYRFKDMRLII